MSERSIHPMPEGLKPDELVQSLDFVDMVGQERKVGFLRQPSGRLVWHLPTYSFERNSARAIANMQLLFAEAFPEFVDQYLNEDFKLRKGANVDECRAFILERARSQVSFKSIFGRSYDHVVIFEHSHIYATARVFAVSGIKIGFDSFGRRPAGYWTNPDVIEAEVGRVVEEQGEFRLSGDEKHRRISQAVRVQYPGSFNALEGKVPGIVRKKTAKGFWASNPKLVLQMAKQFHEEHGGLSDDLLAEHGRYDLTSAIGKYPGNMRGVKQDLGLPANKEWDHAMVISESAAFLAEFRDINTALLKKNGRLDLEMAIRKYPNRVRGVRAALGLEINRKANGYWTEQRIREEVAAFNDKHGGISAALLRANDKQDLAAAIRKGHPGGFPAFLEAFGFTNPKGFINVDEAFGDFFEEEQNG